MLAGHILGETSALPSPRLQQCRASRGVGASLQPPMPCLSWAGRESFILPAAQKPLSKGSSLPLPWLLCQKASLRPCNEQGSSDLLAVPLQTENWLLCAGSWLHLSLPYDTCSEGSFSH